MDNEKKEKKSSGKKRLWIVLLVLVVAAAGSLAGIFIGGKILPNEDKTTKIVKKMNEDEVVVPLDEFLVNLATDDSSEDQYIKVKISLLVPNKDSSDLVQSSVALIRDSVINLLRKKTSSTILKDENGVNNLKTELKNQINTAYGSNIVQEVFITDLVIQ